MMRIGVAQINSTVGDLEGNSKKILEFAKLATQRRVDLLLFPELALTGYPPEDLLLKPKFIQDNLDYLEKIVKALPKELCVVLGFVDCKDSNLYNAAAVLQKQKIQGVYHKIFLPNYGVFDERRYFQPGEKPFVFSFLGFKIGLAICEDLWHSDGPIKKEKESGAKIVLVLNASPYYLGKTKEREKILKKQAKENEIVIAYNNLVGGQDELIFDGQSMVVDWRGEVCLRAKAFQEDLIIFELDKNQIKPLSEPGKLLGEIEEIYQALVLGIKDYVQKNGFQKVVIGLSGGIDSALVCVLAVDALGKENVVGVFLPSEYSSLESREDASELAKNLGIEFKIIPIKDIFVSYLTLLKGVFAGKEADVTEENLQARIRGNILMALSNKFGWLVLTTGNKSEMSTGYATLYGDMAGGFAAIKDVPKTLVYELAKYRNSIHEVIPERVFTKVPSAELKPNQKDTDTLPPYEILDPILKAYVEDNKDLRGIVSMGFSEETVSKVLSMIDKSEYKRRQSPPGIKITPSVFGRDRKMPITNKYRE